MLGLRRSVLVHLWRETHLSFAWFRRRPFELPSTRRNMLMGDKFVGGKIWGLWPIYQKSQVSPTYPLRRTSEDLNKNTYFIIWETGFVLIFLDVLFFSSSYLVCMHRTLSQVLIYTDEFENQNATWDNHWLYGGNLIPGRCMFPMYALILINQYIRAYRFFPSRGEKSISKNICSLFRSVRTRVCRGPSVHESVAVRPYTNLCRSNIFVIFYYTCFYLQSKANKNSFVLVGKSKQENVWSSKVPVPDIRRFATFSWPRDICLVPIFIPMVWVMLSDLLDFH